MEPRNKDYKMKPLNRSVAVLLAVIWITGGIAGLWVSINKGNILLIVISLLAIAYGGLWVRVVQTGRRIEWLLGRGKQ